jgi:hypothetical protein
MRIPLERAKHHYPYFSTSIIACSNHARRRYIIMFAAFSRVRSLLTGTPPFNEEFLNDISEFVRDLESQYNFQEWEMHDSIFDCGIAFLYCILHGLSGEHFEKSLKIFEQADNRFWRCMRGVTFDYMPIYALYKGAASTLLQGCHSFRYQKQVALLERAQTRSDGFIERALSQRPGVYRSSSRHIFA